MVTFGCVPPLFSADIPYRRNREAIALVTIPRSQEFSNIGLIIGCCGSHKRHGTRPRWPAMDARTAAPAAACRCSVPHPRSVQTAVAASLMRHAPAAHPVPKPHRHAPNRDFQGHRQAPMWCGLCSAASALQAKKRLQPPPAGAVFVQILAARGVCRFVNAESHASPFCAKNRGTCEKARKIASRICPNAVLPVRLLCAALV